MSSGQAGVPATADLGIRMAGQRKQEALYHPTHFKRRLSLRLAGSLVVSAAVVVIVFLVGVSIFPSLYRWANPAAAEVDWGTLEGITSLITLALAAGGGLFILGEYFATAVQRRQQQAEAWFNIYKELSERLTNPTDTAARRWIIHHIDPPDEGQPLAGWIAAFKTQVYGEFRGSEVDQAPGHVQLKRVLDTIDFIGFVDQHYWYLADDLVEWMNAPIVKVWDRIGPYVEYEADARNEPDFYASAREFGKKCQQWRREHLGNRKSVIIDQGT
ncbi:MAG: hypothetical protein JW910_21045 [Anaerolineae bacterium]|nr:hypothetical protein [Anaerolineae bacterium]